MHCHISIEFIRFSTISSGIDKFVKSSFSHAKLKWNIGKIENFWHSQKFISVKLNKFKVICALNSNMEVHISTSIPAGIYLLRRRSGIFIVNFEHVTAGWDLVSLQNRISINQVNFGLHTLMYLIWRPEVLPG